MSKDLIVMGKWEQAKLAIAECKNVDELKQIRDKAQALKAYAKQAKESLEAQNNIAEIKLRAERRIGEFSKVLPTSQGTRTDLTSSHDGKKSILKEAGIKHHERYEAIASLPQKDFEEHIEKVKKSNEELTTVGIIRLAREQQKQEYRKNLKPVELPNGKFDIIYADPAWQYENSGFAMSAEQKYTTMPTEDICNLPIKNLSAENCALLLWVTNPLLIDGIKVLESWGFEYKTNFVWTKTRHTAGFYNFGQHELLIVAIKGSMLPENKFKSIIEGSNNIHSKKPESVYKMIEKMYPNGKYLELFARNTKENWTSWGNEI